MGDGYSLRVDRSRVDLWLFRELVRDARDHETVTQALALWRGEPLAELTPLACHPWRSDLAVERGAALSRFADVVVTVGRAADVLAFAQCTARALPLDERIQATLIRLYHAAGRRADALLTYRAVCERLHVDLGVAPGPDLRAAHDVALHTDPPHTAPPVGPSTAPARPFTAAESAEPARVREAWQLPVPAQLPAGIGDFAGRLAQVETLLEALGGCKAAGVTPVAVITGMGGVGKTTLAVHVAHRLADAYPDGQLYVDLHGADGGSANPAAVLSRMLIALGVDGALIPKEIDDRVALYRSQVAGRRILVVLDNAAEEEQVRSLLPGAPSCAAVVTSRSRLTGLSGVRRVDLDVFAPEEALELLGRIVGEQRVRAEGEAACGIVEACGHIPLAVRVAGARLAVRPRLGLARFGRQLADESRRLDQLATGDLTVRATFRLSYASLPAPARQGFRLLGLLDIGDFAGWLLAVLLEESLERSERLLDILAEAQLVTMTGEDATGGPRYRMHDLIRLYARELAEAEDTEETRRAARIRAYGAWLALAESADQLLAYRTLIPLRGPAARHEPPGDTMAGMLADPVRWFQSERVNLSAVILQASRGGHADLAWNLADACVGFYEMREMLDEWRITHTAAMAACADDVHGRAVLARNLSYQSSLPIVQPLVMRRHAESALELFRQAGNPQGEAEALVLLGTALTADGLGEEGLQRLHQARDLAVSVGHGVSLIFIHAVLGFAYREQGELETASNHLERVLELTDGRRACRLRLMALRSLGMVRHYQGRLEESRAVLLEGLNLAQRLGVRFKELLFLLVIGESGVLTGRPNGVDYLARAWALAEETGGEFARALALRSLATLDLAEGRPAKARDRLLFSLGVFRRHGVHHIEVMALKALGHAWTLLGCTAEARQAWEEARTLYQRLGNRTQVAAIDELIGGPARGGWPGRASVTAGSGP
ncbi:ATP-binding protein [Nonomuraea roseola]|uniref:ATP-binding protein n=1 Tax=Nonomuraea roseola TaxID=46179 RepID=UPI0031F88F54